VKAWREDNFTDYLMFQPDSPGSIPVPLKKLQWNWSGEALTNGAGGWALVQSNSFVQVTVSNRDTLEFPHWTNVVHNIDE
jgi:hypothetical protein